MNPHSTAPPPTTTLPIQSWAIGVAGSWLAVWLVGPLLLDTILIRTHDPQLQIDTLRPGDAIRWRSEGWATTHIGPHGFPGWQPRVTEAGETLRHVVIWGDSQVEGVCVPDDDKIHAQTIRLSNGQSTTSNAVWDVLPMGRSGTDARDWRYLLPHVEQIVTADLHVWVITDLSDLTVVARDDADPSWYGRTQASPPWVIQARRWGAEAALIAGKRLLRDPDTGQRKQLDFRIGPRPTPPTVQPSLDSDSLAVVATWVAQVTAQSGGRLAIVYAPATPRIGDGLQLKHPDDAAFDELAQLLHQQSIPVRDLRPQFLAYWRQHHRFPRGFHNGIPSMGHLNAAGNEMVAAAIVDLLQDR